MGAGLGSFDTDPYSDPRFTSLSPEAQAIARAKIEQGQSLDAILPNLQNEVDAQGVTGLPGVTGAPRNPILTELDKNPATANLPEETKIQIAGDLNSPLNPRNKEFVFGTGDEFGRQAQAEQILRDAQGKRQRDQIGQFATEFETAAEKKRGELAERLSSLGRENFQRQNPYILEDLNRRGLLTSETAVNQSQADALKEIELANQERLLGFDTGVFEAGQDIRGSGLESELGGSQEGLDAALELRRSKLQRELDLADESADRAFASSQAKKQRRSNLLTSGIQAGGNIISSAVGKCFDRWTDVDMPDGSTKNVRDIQLGDEIKGGVVSSIRIATVEPGDLYHYRGVNVTGCHAVKHNDEWCRVKDAFGSVQIEGSGPVYCFITSEHRIFVGGIEFADEIEHEGGQYTSLDESLLILNNEQGVLANA